MSDGRTIRSVPRRSGDAPHRGFTLVELLVVVGIIALLLGVVAPTLSRVKDLARLDTGSRVVQLRQGVKLADLRKAFEKVDKEFRELEALTEVQ